MNKGQVSLDIVTFGVILLIVSISVLLGYIIIKEWKTVTDETFTVQEAKDIVAKSETYFSVWDTGFLFLVGGMGIALFISVFYVKTHPAFFFVSLLSLVFALIFIPQLSNVFYAFENNDGLTDYNLTEKFPIMTYIMLNLPFILAVMGIGYLVVLFSKQGVGGSGDTNY
jgi:hypothetical protein